MQRFDIRATVWDDIYDGGMRKIFFDPAGMCGGVGGIGRTEESRITRGLRKLER